MYYKRSVRRGDDEVSIQSEVERRASDCRAHFDCRCLPHGFYPLIPTVLSSMALWTSAVQDGCDYGRLTGEDSIEKITGSDVFPYLEVGLYNYRAPIFYASKNDWVLAFTLDCQDYPIEVVDNWWKIGKYLTIASSILAGTLCLFLWFTTCMSFSNRTWRFCAIESLLAALCRAGSFFFFLTSICKGKGSECNFDFGSKVDVLGILLWVVISCLILGHYPNPKLRKAMEDESMRSEEEMKYLQPKQIRSQRRIQSPYA